MNKLRLAALALAGTLLGLGTVYAFPPGFRPPAYRPPAYRPPAYRPPVYRPPTPAYKPPVYRPPTPSYRLPGSLPRTPTWSLPTYRTPTRTPAQYEAILRGTARTSPTDSLRALRGTEAYRLSQATRVSIARDAARSLSVRVEGMRDPAAGLALIDRARIEMIGLPLTERAPLERLRERTGRALLGEAAQDIAAVEPGNLADAGSKAEGWVKKLQANRPPRLDWLQGDHAAVEAAMQRFVSLGRRADALARLDAAMQGKGWGRVDARKLPRELARHAEVLRSVADLKHAATAQGAPDVPALKRALEHLGDPALANEAALDLASRALIEGHAEAFDRLMPKAVDAEQAAQVLRDLKAMALGEGKVEGWAARQSHPEAARPPPGLEPLVPEGERAGWKPPVVEKASAGLPAMERAAALGEKAAARAKTEATAEKARLAKSETQARKALEKAKSQATAPLEAERIRFARVETRLARQLTPAERSQVRDLFDQGKEVEDVLAKLKKQAGDDEEQFLAEVARALGRPLTLGEKQQARRLRRQGRRAAEVAVILRS